MTPRKTRERRPNSHNHNSHNHHQHRSLQQSSTVPQPSDYESDTAYYLSDTQQHDPAMPPPVTRSNEELNISVLRRHNPAISSILSLAPYAVVYFFSPATRQWEKSGVEGSMFVCQLTQGRLGEERYSVFVLNRRGLDNFDIRLTDGENVELTDEYVILKADDDSSGDSGGGGGGNNNGDNNANNARIYGLWIYSEPPPNSTAETRAINAQMIKECAVHAGESLKLARERLEAERQNGLHAAAAAAAPDGAYSSVPMSRQISLKELFGQQRAQDDGWSVKAHSPGPVETQQNSPWPQQHPQTQAAPAAAGQDVLGELFRRAGVAYQSGQRIS
ncbi:hypothetical protein VTN00DRAFT_1265 [Thermoascus crustaceus]|uniref:uncharacterized protein n=1 Tax=Thermoascus crustaceus TaxID=5088 RepID=UPI0037421D98